MIGQLLDLETLARLAKAAPKVVEEYWVVAKKFVEALTNHSTPDREHDGMDGRRYWLVLLAMLAETLPVEDKTDRRTGQLCRQLGLIMWRRRDGYWVAWNREQLDILRSYFKL
jgi:hypothetical protein